MRNNVQNGRTTYRLITLRRSASEILLLGDGKHFALPSVESPHDRRLAETICVEFKKRWNFDIYCLFVLNREELLLDSPNSMYQVAAPAKSNQTAPTGMSWTPISTLSRTSLENVEDFTPIMSAIRELEENERRRTRGPFGRTDWIEELFAWTEGVIAHSGMKLTGQFSQLNASASTSLIRLETTGRSLWFKAVPASQSPEFSISNELSRLFPSFVPLILGSRPDWSGWLFCEVDGRHPNEISDLNSWFQVTETLARLQLASLPETNHLLTIGCKNLTTQFLLHKIHSFLNFMEGNMEAQQSTERAKLSGQELRQLGMDLEDALLRVGKIGVPDALGHQDFNPGNILVSAQACIFLDWAEGCVGSPFFTLHYLVEHLRKLSRNIGSFEETRVISRYAKHWESVLSPENLQEALSLTRLLAVFAYAISLTTWKEGSHPAVP